MNATAIIGIVILVLFVGSFIAYGVVLYLGREHKQTVLVKSKYTTKNPPPEAWRHCGTLHGSLQMRRFQPQVFLQSPGVRAHAGGSELSCQDQDGRDPFSAQPVKDPARERSCAGFFAYTEKRRRYRCTGGVYFMGAYSALLESAEVSALLASSALLESSAVPASSLVLPVPLTVKLTSTVVQDLKSLVSMMTGA